MKTKIDREVAAKVLSVVDAGLSRGLGKPKPGEMCVEAAVCFALGLPHSDDPGCVSSAVRSLKITLNDKKWSSNEARAKGLRRLAIIQLGTKDETDDKAFVAAVAEMTIRKIVPIALRAAASMRGGGAHKKKLKAAAKRCEDEGTNAAADAAYAAADAANAVAAANAAAYAVYAANAAAAAYAADAADAANAANAAADAAYAAAYAADAAYAAVYAADADAAYAKRDGVLAAFAENVVQILVKMGVKAADWLDLAPLEQ